MRVLRLITLLTLLSFGAYGGSATLAAPGPRAAAPVAIPQSVEWLSPETAARLDLGFDVLIPPTVPAPFEGEPDVTSHDGYYSLYWVIPGTPPTFLQITGEVDGTIPDYSKYDRNNQLEQNAEVDGHPAYHDLTPIYDLVYWRVDDVVYSVESRNLTEDDSLSLANALVPIAQGQPDDSEGESSSEETSPALSLPDRVDAGETISIGVQGVTGARLTADWGVFTETGEATYDGAGGSAVSWQAPAPEDDTWVTFTLIDPDSGETLATGSTLVLAAVASEPRLSLSCPESAGAGQTMEFVLSGAGAAIVDAGAGLFPQDGANSGFEAAGEAGRTIVGEVPESGEITLAWIAPSVTEATTVYLFATTELGETTGECAVEVVPLAAGEGAGGDAEVSAQSVDDPPASDGGDGAARQSSGQDAESQSERNQEQPTAKAKADKATKPAEIRNEVRGLSTVIPATGGGGEAAPSPSPTVRSSPTPRPTATIAPTISDDGMVATLIGPEGGSLTSPGGVTVTLPPGALTEQATLSIRPVSDTKLPVQEGVDLIPASGFDVAIAAPNGRAIEQIQQPAEIRIDLGKERMKSGAKLYRVEGAQLVPLSNTRAEGTSLVITVEGFSRFVAGVPSTVSGTKNRSLLPFVLAAVVVILVLIAMTVLGGMFRPRRQRVIVSRRPPRSRYR